MQTEIPLNQSHRLIAPRPVCLLTTSYHGQVNVMAASWVCPVSLEPPMVLVAVHPATHTHGMLMHREECVLNVPGRALAEQVQKAGMLTGADMDKVAQLGLTLESGRRVEVPHITECLAYLECAIVDVLQPGDHTLFVAQVIGAWAEEDAFGGSWLAPEDNEELCNLLHLGGSAFCLPGKRIAIG
ncbi:MAG: flavin reductase family protein [Anaerolineae bacterium]